MTDRSGAFRAGHTPAGTWHSHRFPARLAAEADARALESEGTMYVDDIAEMRALRPWVALSVTMERRAIRLGKFFAGELFIHRERARHAAALLQAIAEEYFRERPSVES